MPVATAIELFRYPPSIFFQGMKYMLFGDPTLPLAPPPDVPADVGESGR